MTVSKANVPTPEMLRKLLEYNPATGGLTWRPRAPDLFEDGKQTAEHNCNRWNAVNAGKAAFTADNGRGYLKGSIFGGKFRASRVIWAMEAGAWPTGHIDHINGVRTDNRIANLRDVSHSDNLRNQSRRKTNKSGVMGVHFSKHSGKWLAYIHANGKQIHLGLFTSKAAAIAARKAAEIKNGYHENHGRDAEL